MPVNPWKVGNQHGYLCPSCERGAVLQVVITAWATLLPDGTDLEGAQEWGGDSLARCGCGWYGLVRELMIQGGIQ